MENRVKAPVHRVKRHHPAGTDVTRRVVAVTGAASGIGAGIAAMMAEAGHRVAILDRDAEAATATAEMLAADGYEVMALNVDVSIESSVHNAIATIKERWGAVEILVNNAGFARDGMLDEMPTDDWDAVFATHLRGAFLLTRATAGDMKTAKWGRIVNISSISALGATARANYVAAKAGLEALTRASALELGPHGITVNAVAPGFVVTGMTRVSAARAGRSLEEHIRIQAKGVLVGRAGTPRDVARAVAFFADEDADFVTGQVIYVSGCAHG